MKKILLGILLVGATVMSCQGLDIIKGNGKVAHGEFDISGDYTGLSVSRGIIVELIEQEGLAGTITCDEKVLEYVAIIEKDGIVTVGYEPCVTVNSSVKTIVTMPLSSALSDIDASSAGSIKCDVKLSRAAMDIEVSSAARIELDVEAGELSVDVNSAAKFEGTVVAAEFDVELDSAARCSVAGNVDRCNIDVNSASNFNGYDLVCKSVDAEASSAGSIEVTATEDLNAEASSGASIRYKGSPRYMREDSSSGGSVKRVG